MALGVDDLRDLLKLLEQHPEWTGELRRHVLQGDLLELPAVVRQLAEAQLRTEQRLEALTERVDALTARVDLLAEKQAEMVLVLQVMGQKIDQLVGTVAKMTDLVGLRAGQLLELEYTKKAVGRFGRIARRGRVLEPEALVGRLDDAVDDGRLTWEERNSLLDADIVMEGRRTSDGVDVYVLAEVSQAIDFNDVRRAHARSETLAKLGRTVIPVVCGRTIDPAVDRTAMRAGVWRVLNGRTISPEEEAR